MNQHIFHIDILHITLQRVNLFHKHFIAATSSTGSSSTPPTSFLGQHDFHIDAFYVHFIFPRPRQQAA